MISEQWDSDKTFLLVINQTITSDFFKSNGMNPIQFTQSHFFYTKSEEVVTAINGYDKLAMQVKNGSIRNKYFMYHLNPYDPSFNSTMENLSNDFPEIFSDVTLNPKFRQTIVNLFIDGIRLNSRIEEKSTKQ